MNRLHFKSGFTLLLVHLLFAVSAAFAQTDNICSASGDWDDSTHWSLGHCPQPSETVHINGGVTVTKSGIPVTVSEIHIDNQSTLILNTAYTCTGLLHINNRSMLNVNAPVSCVFLHMDNRATVCLNAPFTACNMTIDNKSTFYGNGQNVTITNCNSVSSPIQVFNQSYLAFNSDCSGNMVSGGTLTINGNASVTNCDINYNNITITNGTLNWGSCDVTILGKVTLNAGGDFTTTGNITYGPNAELVFNRSYTLTGSSKVWSTGTGNGVPPVVTILSGMITTNDSLTVKSRINLMGGTIGSGAGTKLKLISGDTLFKCGGSFYSTPLFYSGVTTLYCDVQPGNPPLVLGPEMPAGGFTGDVIVSTNLVLGSNIATSGNVIVTRTGVLNDSNFVVSRATQVQVQNGGIIVTDKSGGLTGPNSLLGSVPLTLSAGSTVVYNSTSGTQTVSPLSSYYNITFQNASAKAFPANSTTTIQGDVTNTGTGTISAGTGSTTQFTGANQNIAGMAFYNVDFGGTGTKSITGASTVAANMNIVVNASVVVNTNNNVTLLSGPAGTAQIGPLLNGADIIGNICWQRFIPGGPSNRRWRFLSNPIKNVTFRWWQNDIFITGPGTGGVPCAWGTTSTTSMRQNSNGFDQNQSGANSCFTWNETTASWQTIPRTFDTINPLIAYRTFVRGNRNIEGCVLMTNMPDSVSDVTLHSCGPIVKFTQSIALTRTPGVGNGWNYVSNPYPSSINWWDPTWVSQRGSTINPTVYIWDPVKNQYTTWNPYSGGTNGGSNIIGTGQSFFITTNANTNLVFQESYKVDSGQMGFFGKANTLGALSNNMKITLQGTDSRDETIIYLHKNATSGYDNVYDGYKMGYTNGSVASYTSVNTSKLAFNGIAPVTNQDTLFLSTYLATTTSSYTFTFSGINTFDPQYIILLKDKYLGVYTNLLSTRAYSFATVTGVASSYAQDRFEIIIMNASALPVTLSDFKAEKESSRTVLVTWSTASEVNNSHFILEHSVDGITFSQLDIIKGAGNSNTRRSYTYTHMNPAPGMNYYRLVQVDNNNTKNESYIASVNFTGTQTGIVTVFPVPAKNTLNINFGNSQFSGFVTVKIFDMVGREVITRQLSVNAIVQNQTLPIDISILNNGSYFLSLLTQNGTEQKIKFIKD
jgi:hypothetical protein